MILCGRGARSESRGAETSSRGRSGRLVSSGPLLDMRAARGDQSPCRAGTSSIPPPRPSSGRVLIVRMSHLGDIAQTLPLLHAVSVGPGVEVAWAIQPEFAGLVEPLVERVVHFDRRGGLMAWPRPPRPARLRSRPRHRRAGERKSVLAASLSGAPRRLTPHAALARNRSQRGSSGSRRSRWIREGPATSSPSARRWARSSRARRRLASTRTSPTRNAPRRRARGHSSREAHERLCSTRGPLGIHAHGPRRATGARGAARSSAGIVWWC